MCVYFHESMRERNLLILSGLLRGLGNLALKLQTPDQDDEVAPRCKRPSTTEEEEEEEE